MGERLVAREGEASAEAPGLVTRMGSADGAEDPTTLVASAAPAVC